MKHPQQVIRFWNNDVMNNIENVMIAINQALEAPAVMLSYLTEKEN